MSEILSKEDLKKVDNCEYYLRTKQIMKNAELYKNLQVGEVYYIKTKDYNGKEQYVSAGWNADPSKYIVFHKDGGFVFIKRIISTGKPGQEVMCLTTQFNIDEYWLEADPDYVNSILLQDEESYDPFAASKKESNKKNKARRKNKKLELVYISPVDAFNLLDSLSVGDVLYDASTAYGSDILTWEVVDIRRRPVDIKAVQVSPEDAMYYKNGFKDVLLVKIRVRDKVLPRKRRYISVDDMLTINNFIKDKHWQRFYKVKPFTVDDV